MAFISPPAVLASVMYSGASHLTGRGGSVLDSISQG